MFFATPDVLSGLFTLSNFEEGGLTNVVAPFSAGCGSIVMWPSVERTKKEQRSFLGMFDVSARPAVSPDVLSFAIPFEKFVGIVDCMEESFVTTHSWDKVKERMVKN